MCLAQLCTARLSQSLEEPEDTQYSASTKNVGVMEILLELGLVKYARALTDEGIRFASDVVAADAERLMGLGLEKAHADRIFSSAMTMVTKHEKGEHVASTEQTR